MPRLGEALRDISTEVRVPDDGRYTAELSVTDTKSKKSKKDMTVFTFKVIGTEFDGLEVIERFVTEGDQPGSYNERGLRGLKKMAMAVVGDRVNDPDFDTAELDGTLVEILVKRDSYEDEDTKEEVPQARVKLILGRA